MKKKSKINKKKPSEVTPHSAIYKLVRKLVVLVIGGSVVVLGIAFIFSPVPAIIVIPIGLTILATEFIWARHLLKQLKEKLHDLKDIMTPGK